MINLPTVIFSLLAYQSASLLYTESVAIGAALVGGVLFQMLLNRIAARGMAQPPAPAKPAGHRKGRKLKLDKFSDRPAITWKGNARDPLNPLDL